MKKLLFPLLLLLAAHAHAQLPTHPPAPIFRVPYGVNLTPPPQDSSTSAPPTCACPDLPNAPIPTYPPRPHHRPGYYNRPQDNTGLFAGIILTAFLIVLLVGAATATH